MNSKPEGEKHVLINWDGGSLEHSLLSHRVGQDAAGMQRLIEDAVDEHARAGVGSYAHVVFAQFRANLPSSDTLQTTDWGWSADWQETLRAADVDLMRVIMDRCRDRGIAFLACLRMNDRHGNSVKGEFWKEHPLWRLEDYRGGLDYRHEGVREKLLAFIEELLSRYEVDGIEFDYMRWCHVFNRAEAEGNAPMLTDMTAKARKLLDDAARRRGTKHLRFGVRIPPTLEECKGLGFDVAAWVSQDLVDYIVPSDFFHTDINTRVEDFVALTEGTACRVYPAIHPLIGRGNQHNLMHLTHYRAAAQNFYAHGAHGISPYNYMYTWDKRRSPGYEGAGLQWPAALGWLRELADPARVATGDRHYLFHTMWDQGAPTGYDKDWRINLTQAEPVGRQLFRLCEDLADPDLRAVVQFKAIGLDASETLLIELNGRKVNDMQATRVADPDGQSEYEGRKMGPFHLYVIDVPHGDRDPMLVNGDNELSVTRHAPNGMLEGTVTIDELEVYVYVSA